MSTPPNTEEPGFDGHAAKLVALALSLTAPAASATPLPPLGATHCIHGTERILALEPSLLALERFLSGAYDLCLSYGLIAAVHSVDIPETHARYFTFTRFVLTSEKL